MDSRTLRVGVPLLMLALAACDTGSGPENGEVPMTVSVTVQPRAGLAGVAAGAWTPALTHGASTLELNAVTLEVEELVLERRDGEGAGDSDGDSEEDSDSDGPSNEEFAVEGATVDLPLQGGVITPFSEGVPAGLYEELEIDVISVRLVGTVDGEAFDVVVPVELELEMEFEPFLEVLAGDEPFNVTMSVDPLSWLEHEDGSFMDPRDFADDGSLLTLFRQRMALSFKAFEDSDHDGDEQDSDSDSG